ncbi:hypothetical protein HRbin27_01716 [bacterium HR27]|nr:hypothetical protein HRbin27_01716 [bacterium HR27]
MPTRSKSPTIAAVPVGAIHRTAAVRATRSTRQSAVSCRPASRWSSQPAMEGTTRGTRFQQRTRRSSQSVRSSIPTASRADRAQVRATVPTTPVRRSPITVQRSTSMHPVTRFCPPFPVVGTSGGAVPAWLHRTSQALQHCISLRIRVPHRDTCARSSLRPVKLAPGIPTGRRSSGPTGVPVDPGVAATVDRHPSRTISP